MQSNKIIITIILLVSNSLYVFAQHQGIKQLDTETAISDKLKTNYFFNHYLAEVYPIFEIGK